MPVPAKFGRHPFARSSINLSGLENDRMTERMTECQTERSHNLRLVGGANKLYNYSYILYTILKLLVFVVGEYLDLESTFGVSLGRRK